MSASAGNCPTCGFPLPADAPRGLCPECLLMGGFATGVASCELESRASAEAEPAAFVGTALDGSEALGRFGDFELLEQIAAGGMGVVFKARQLSLNRVVAVKMIRASQRVQEGDLRRFRTEAEAAANLKHPHIVPIHEIGEHQGRPYFSMDFIEGQTLADLVRDQPLEPAHAARLVQTIAEAMAYAHSRGVLHRDLKPSNVMIDALGQPHVADFGLAKLFGTATDFTNRSTPGAASGRRSRSWSSRESESVDSELAVDRTLTGQILGSPSYMSPEQAAGKHRDTTMATDVYSLGAVLYDLLTARPPFCAPSPLETIAMVAESEPVAPRVFNPAVPSDLETVCLKCLEKDPSRRYAGAQELADDLGRFLRREPIRARPAGLGERAVKWARRRPARAGLIGVSITAVLTLVTVLWVDGENIRRQRDAVRKEQETTAENLYAADLFLGFQALERENLGLARRALMAQRPLPGRRDLRGFEWRWLWGECRGDDVASLVGPGEEVNCVAFSPDGRLLAQGGWRTPALLWDWRAGQYLGQVPDADAPRSQLEQDLGRILMKRPSLMAQIVAAKETPASLNRKIRPTQSGYVTSVAFSNDGKLLATGETDRFTKLWRLPDRRLLNVLPKSGTRVAFVPGTNWLVVGLNPSDDGSRLAGIGCFDPATFSPMLMFTQANGYFAISSDGRRLALSPPGGPVRVHALPSGTISATMEFGGCAIALSFAGDGRTLAVSDASEPRVALFDVGTGKRLGEVGRGLGRLERVVFSPDGSHLATGGADHTLRLWNVATREAVGVWRGHEAEVRDVAFTPDGKWLVTAGKDKTVRLWDASARRTNETVVPVTGDVLSSADGRWLLGRGETSGWELWDLDSSRKIGAPALQTNEVPLGIDHAQREIVVARWTSSLVTNRLRRLEIASGRVSTDVALGGAGLLRIMALSPDSARVAGARMHGRIALFDGATGVRERDVAWSGIVEATALRFSPRGDRLLAVAGPDRLSMWTVPELVQLWELTNSSPASWAFSADGTKLALGQEDNLVTVWNVTNGAPLAAFGGHKQRVSRVCFTRNGATLASASADGQVRFWHLRTLRELGAWAERGDCDFLNFVLGDDALCVGRAGLGVRIRRVPTLATADQEAAGRPERAGSKGFSAAVFQP